jgi:GNAT superfamily N-acetyltransferase
MVANARAVSPVVRRARLHDLAELARMRIALQAHLKASNPRVWGLEPQSAPAIAAGYREIMTKSPERAAIHVAELPGGPGLAAMAMGRVAVRPEFAPSVTGLVDDVWVEPELRGRGLARELLAELVAFFRRHGAEIIVLDYVIANREAERLWSRLGFVPVQVGADARLDDLEAALRLKRAS